MVSSEHCQTLEEDVREMQLTCAETRKQSALLREDARECRNIAEQIRAQGARLRARAPRLIQT